MTKKEVEQIVYRTIINAFKKFYQKSMTNKNKIRPRSYPFITTKGTDDYDEDTLEEFVIPEIPTNKNKKRIMKAVEASNKKQRDLLDRYDKEFPDGPKKFYKGRTWHDSVSMIDPEEETNKNKNEEVWKAIDAYIELVFSDRTKKFIGETQEYVREYLIVPIIQQQRASAVREFAERLKGKEREVSKSVRHTKKCNCKYNDETGKRYGKCLACMEEELQNTHRGYNIAVKQHNKLIDDVLSQIEEEGS